MVDRTALEARIQQYLDFGDLAKAATEALEGYGAEIRGYLAAILRDKAAATDVFADFCEDLWKGLPGFRMQSSFRTWAYRVAWNAAQMFWRDSFRQHVRRLTTSEYSLIPEPVRERSLRSHPLDPGDELAKLRESLGPEEQTLLILRVDRALPWKDIAQILAAGEGAPLDVGALRKRFERLKEKLIRIADTSGLLHSISH